MKHKAKSKRSKKFYFFSTLAALILIWILLVVFDQGPVSVLHDSDSELALSRAAEMPGVECVEKVISVALVEGDKPDYSLVGELCAIGGFDNKTLQVLVSGAGYGSVYWDFPYQPETYSYMRAALAAGDAVFNFDRLGIGKSDHPFGMNLDVDTQAYVLAQTISALTAEQTYDAVVTLGHSFGSVIALSHALAHPEQVAGIVLTGYAHNVNPEFGPSMGQGIEVAAFGGPFVGDIFDPTYLISKPGSRANAFYTSANTDPGVVLTDDLTRQTTAAGELISMNKYFADQSLGLAVPVLMIVGDDDFLVCGGDLDCSDHAAIIANETPYYSPAACLELIVLDDTNHNANLHKNAPQTFALMLDWVGRYVGSAGRAASEPCLAS